MRREPAALSVLRPTLVGLAALLLATVAVDADDGVRFDLKVMSFNINDLPSPLRSKSSAAMKIIGRDLARRMAEGTAPEGARSLQELGLGARGGDHGGRLHLPPLIPRRSGWTGL